MGQVITADKDDVRSDAPQTGFVVTKQVRGKPQVVLDGRWTIENTGEIEAAIAKVKREIGRKTFEVDAGGLEKLDTSGALLLKQLLPDGELPKHLERSHRALLEFLPSFAPYAPKEARKESHFHAVMSRFGKKIYDGLDFGWSAFAFIGRVAARLWQNILSPRHFRIASIVRHMQETGIEALLIVGLLAVLISMVITYQGAVQLSKFGADVFTIDLTVVALLREMGVLVTAIIVAGRSGSAFAAEIGVMKLRDEVSALKTMGIDPIEALVLPRVIALVVTLPLLTFFANIVGLAGGSVMSLSLLGISFDQYFSRVESVATPVMFFVGMIKAPAFAFIIAIVGCYQGLNVTGSAESIGRMTTLAVVQAIFLVIMADAVFSVIFSKFGI